MKKVGRQGAGYAQGHTSARGQRRGAPRGAAGAWRAAGRARSAPNGHQGSHEDLERAVAVLREQGEGDTLHGVRGDYLGATLSVRQKHGVGGFGWTGHVPRRGCPGQHVSNGSSRGVERGWRESEGIRGVCGYAAQGEVADFRLRLEEGSQIWVEPGRCSSSVHKHFFQKRK